MDKQEISKKKHRISQEEVVLLKGGIELFGYKMIQWYDGDFLVLISPGEEEKSLTPYEVSALDILLSVAEKKQGLKKEDISLCPVLVDLLEQGWIIEEENAYFLSKRTKAEKKNTLSSKSSVEVCGFCGILNNEGNIPHSECTRYNNTSIISNH